MNKEELQKKLEEYAEKQGFRLQPDKEIFDALINGLLRNYEKYGALYCPCRRVSGDFRKPLVSLTSKIKDFQSKEKDKEIICPCKFHKEEIEKDGYCKCRLFLER